MKKLHAILLLGASALVLTACGGGGGDPAPAPAASTGIPATATADSAGLVGFTNAQIGASSDTTEPLLVGDAVLPTDDTTETSL